MPILYGVLASVGIGISDYFGRYCSRRDNPTTTVLTALMVGVFTALVLTMVVPSERIVGDIGLGAISGMTVGFALMLMYWGLAVSSTAVVSPVVAFFVAAIPLAWDIVVGVALSARVAAGVAVAIVGIVVSTISSELQGRVLVGLTLAAGSGLLFGVAMAVAGETSIESGLWPAVAQRSTAWVTLAIYASVRGLSPLLGRRLLRLGLLSGLAGTTGMAMFILGSQRGSLGPVAVASSMFPAVTAVLAVIFDDDKLRWWQWVGIVVALAGVALIAAG